MHGMVRQHGENILRHNETGAVHNEVVQSCRFSACLRYASAEFRYAAAGLRYAALNFRYAPVEFRYVTAENRYAGTSFRYAGAEIRYAAVWFRYANRRVRYADVPIPRASMTANAREGDCGEILSRACQSDRRIRKNRV